MTGGFSDRLQLPLKRLGRGVALAATAVFMLAACADDETYLVGEREDIRSILSDGEAPDLAASGNTSAPLRLATPRANADWAQFWGTPAYRTAHPALGQGLTLAWSADIGQGDGRRQRISAAPVVGGGRIFTLDAAAQVSAVSPEGAVLWSRDLTPATDRSDEGTGGGLAYADGVIYVSLGFGHLHALDAASGATRWEQALDATGSGAPTVRGGLVYLVTGDDTAWAIEADSGRVRWQTGTAGDVVNVLGAPAPILSDDLVIFGFGSGDVRAVFRRGGLARWETAVVGERRGYASSKLGDLTAPPVLDGAQIYAGNLSGRVAALSLGNGERIWTAREGTSGPIWPSGGSVFFVSDQNELIRLSASDGTRIWGTDLPRFVNDRPRRRAALYAHYGPILAGGRLLVASSDGLLRSFSPTDGALISQTEIPGGAAAAPAIAGRTLYVLSTKGQLLAYR